jgi:Flp pilus assembly pilin Flp
MRQNSNVEHDLRGDDRGGVAVEYAVILALVAVGLSAAVLGLGTALVEMFVARETWLLLPFP